MLVTKEEHDKKINEVKEVLKNSVWFEAKDLVDKGVFKKEIDAKVFIDKNLSALGFKRKSIYTRGI